MRPYFDPPSLTPEDRFSEVAALLAVGLLRLHTATLEKSSNSSLNSLELPCETVLSGDSG